MNFTWVRLVLLLVVFYVLGSLAHKYASQQPYTFFRSAIWSDKAGYYVYLPYTFMYGSSAEMVPDSLFQQTGLGFKKENDKLITKYPVGVAYLEAPFFFGAWLVDAIRTGGKFSNPFDGIYTKWMVWAPAFYVTIGLYLLFLSLRLLNIKPVIALLTSLFVILGTSLLYYTVIEGLMSHSFSFALFSLFTYLWLGVLNGNSKKAHLIGLALSIGLIVAVRPFNATLIILYASALMMITKTPFKIVITKIFQLLPWLIPIAIVLALPQLAYYKSTYGSWFVYTYGEEGFDFMNPQLKEMLISPMEGLFVYVPAFVLLAAALFIKAGNSIKQFGLLALMVVALTYVLASWHSWSFGCGFGIRPYVELLPILVIPFSVWLQNMGKAKFGLYFAMLLIIGYNIFMTYQWSGCWFGKEDSFAEYFRLFWQ